ncbi:MAG: DUF3108 domain-containing protein [Burkholderiaceae bacterium]|nr:DUF3108 domain-containing protein [Burkholderiaceae bacterium]
MSSLPIATPAPSRRRAGRVAAVLLASVALHALVLHRARDELAFDLPPPPTSTVQVELFRLPAQVAVAQQPAAAPKRTPRAITPPAPSAPPAAPAPAASVETEPAPDAPAPLPTPPGDEVLPSGPANALPQEVPVAPIDAVVVSFPKVGRFVSDTTYRKGILEVRGTTTIEWRIGNDAYEANSVTLDADGRRLLTLESRGAVRPAIGIAPERYVEQRLERAKQAVNFQWDARKVTFSAASAEYPLNDGVQDQLSFMAQLALLAQAFPERFQPGMPVALELAGTRNVRVYEFRVIGWETLNLAAGALETLKIERVVVPGARDARIALWLAPTLRWLPARTRTVLPNEDIIETVLKDVWFIE